jgi:hypothetical protein
MQLPDDKHIVTPTDRWPEWDPDWRASLAAAWARFPLWSPGLKYKAEARDPWVHAYRDYLKQYAKGNLAVIEANTAFNRVTDWGLNRSTVSTGSRLEALLLTSVSYDQIATDLFGSSGFKDHVLSFERLFYDVREDNGELTPLMARREWLALPDNMVGITEKTDVATYRRFVGHRYGYPCLGALLSLPGAEDCSKADIFHGVLKHVIQSEMLEQLVRGQIGSRDMPNYLGQIVAYESMLFTTGKGAGDDESEAVKGLLQVLELHRPKRLVAASTMDSDERTRARAESLEAQLEVKKQKLLDRGKAIGHQAVTEMVRNSFKANISAKA